MLLYTYHDLNVENTTTHTETEYIMHQPTALGEFRQDNKHEIRIHIKILIEHDSHALPANNENANSYLRALVKNFSVM